MTLKILYGAGSHNYAYACFACRKSFKRPLVSLQKPVFHTRQDRQAFIAENSRFIRGFRHKCPDCAGPACFMGRDFRAPKMGDLKAWRRIERFIASSRTFHQSTPMDDTRWPLQRRFN